MNPKQSPKEALELYQRKKTLKKVAKEPIKRPQRQEVDPLTLSLKKDTLEINKV